MKHKPKQNCSECKKFSSIVNISYMKKSLCRNCFLKFFERRVSRAIRKENLLKKEDRVAVLVSENLSSSLVLLKVLHKLSRRAPKSKLTAILISEKKKIREILRKFCNELEVEIDKFNQNLDKFDKIAIPENLDDQVKSAILNLIDGDYERIAKINENQRIIKPLKECPYNEILTYAYISKIPIINKKEKLAEDAIEKFLERIQKKNPGAKFQILRSIESLRNIFRK